MMIFRILCGEWIEPLWDCMRAEAKVNIITRSRDDHYKIQHMLFIGRRIDMFRHLPANACDGQFHGFELVLGLVA